jgi:hypothetical protein
MAENSLDIMAPLTPEYPSIAAPAPSSTAAR